MHNNTAGRAGTVDAEKIARALWTHSVVCSGHLGKMRNDQRIRVKTRHHANKRSERAGL